MKRLRIVELYAGTGRSLEPFRQWNRAEIALLVDNNPLAAETYRYNFRNAPYAVLDLSKAPTNEILRLSGNIDVLLGCPPCQGFSDVGKKDPDDPRNEHLGHFSRIAAAARPLAIGMENVPLAAASDEFRRFVRRFERLGYRWTAGILNAALHGSAQCRQRLIYVALRDDVGVAPALAAPSHGGTQRYFSYGSGKMEPLTSDRIRMLGEAPSSRRTARQLPHRETEFGICPIPTVGDILDGLPRAGSRRATRINHVPWMHTSPMLRRMARVPEGGRWKGGTDHYSHAYARLHRRGLARTITNFFPNPGSGRFWHPTADRTLTLREAARLQGFPDSFIFLPPHFSKAAFLVGNALDGHLAQITFDAIRNALD